MPTYEYECLECGHAFENFQSMSADPLKDCPKDDCDGKVRRLVSAGSGIIFKGSGFYETDYKKKSGSKTDSCSETKSCPNAKACAAASKGD
jgi:putative FmdB family regulatory protein